MGSNNWPRHTLKRPTTTETRVAYNNSTWHAINTGYTNSTKGDIQNKVNSPHERLTKQTKMQYRASQQNAHDTLYVQLPVWMFNKKNGLVSKRLHNPHKTNFSTHTASEKVARADDRKVSVSCAKNTIVYLLHTRVVDINAVYRQPKCGASRRVFFPCVQCFRVSIPPAVRPTRLRQMDMGSV